MALIVTAGSVTVETSAGAGRARLDFYRGQALPDDIGPEDRERVLRLGDAEEADDKDAAAEDADPDALVTGTIEAVLAWVGADADRAQRALDAETADKGKNRTTLIDRLTAIVEPPPPPPE
jgi:hypothetical protein